MIVYSANMGEILHKQDTKFEVTLSANISEQELASHDVFKSVEKTDDFSFIAESDLSAEKLSEYIVKQQWGLTRFAPFQTSLEQIFIDLTLAESNTHEAETGRHPLEENVA